MSIKKQSTVLVLLFILAFAIRIGLIFSSPYKIDIETFEYWGSLTNKYGVTNVYSSAEGASIDYPPAYIYLLGVIDKLNTSVFHFQQYSYQHHALIKGFNILVDISLGICIYLFASKQFSSKKGLIAAAFFLLNPYVIYNSVVWGQVDALYALFIVISIIMVQRKHLLLSGVFVTLSLLVKLQGIIGIPILMLYIFITFGFKATIKFLSGAYSSFLLFCSPFLIAHTFTNVLNIYRNSASRYPFLSMNAYNLWWPWSNPYNIFDKQDTQFIIGKINAKTTGLIMFSGAYIWLSLSTFLNTLKNKIKESSINKQETGLSFALLCMSLAYLAFYTLNTEMHERYMYVLFPLMSLIIVEKKHYYFIYVVLSFTQFINLYWANHFLTGISNSNPLFYTWGSITLSVINISILAFALYMLTTRKKFSKGLIKQLVQLFKFAPQVH